MKMNIADFEKYVKQCRQSAPACHMGRNGVIVSEYSKKGAGYFETWLIL